MGNIRNVRLDTLDGAATAGIIDSFRRKFKEKVLEILEEEVDELVNDVTKDFDAKIRRYMDNMNPLENSLTIKWILGERFDKFIKGESDERS